MKDLDCCTLCPRNCRVNRNKGEVGFCKAKNKLVIGRASLHMWEEPCISGEKGSGTIFFSYCNLQCIFCQNYEISKRHCGKEVSVERFSEICLELQEKGALNINLVTPTHFIPLIKEGLILAKEKGLSIPIVYNTSSYENVESLRELNGIVDIYLPDLKYYFDDAAISYSNAPNYFSYAKDAIEEMYRQVENPVFDQDGIMKKGVIVRHLVLPGRIEESKRILNYLYETYHNSIWISIMSQYTPVKETSFENLNRSLTKEEYDEVVHYAMELGIENAFIQEGEADSSSFIPNFNGEGV